MVAIPGAFCPIPLTLVGIGSWYLILGPNLTTLIFVTIFFAYFTLCGTGIISKITKKAAERQALKEAKEQDMTVIATPLIVIWICPNCAGCLGPGAPRSK